MATQAQMDRLVGKALFDTEFRKLLIEDPEKAAGSLRYQLTEPQLRRISGLSAETLEQLAAKFDKATAIGGYAHGISFW